MYELPEKGKGAGKVGGANGAAVAERTIRQPCLIGLER